MKKKSILNLFSSKTGAFLSFVFSVFAFIAIKSATWTYGWIAQTYPLGDKFISTFLIVIGIVAVIDFLYLLYITFVKECSKTAVIIHALFSVLSVIVFVYSLVLLFGIDSGITGAKIVNGLSAVSSKLIYFALCCFVAMALMLCEKKKQGVKALISSVLVCAIILSMSYFSNAPSGKNESETYPQMTFTSDNFVEDGEIVFESLNADEKPDAQNILFDNDKCWTAEKPDVTSTVNNSYVEIKLKDTALFNTAVIEEVGNQAQYFRLQAKIDNEWITIYQSEKIQSLRICSFDGVKTDSIRLSVDKFRSDNNPVKIKSIKLYNEVNHAVDNFEVTAYQRLDGDIPTEILAKGNDYVKNYAKFYDVYSTVILFAAVHWDENANLTFGDMGEEEFARQTNALKQIIAQRSNPNHKVKLIVTALADGTWGDEHNGVNAYMATSWESVANQIVDFVNKYDFDGVDIDWEYPQSADDWANYDKFMQKLSADLKKTNPDSIISTALSSGQLGLSQATYDCIDQIQFMAYDGNDDDGYQSSLQQAEEGLREFKNNGADISKINIGIASYGRPVNSTPYWAFWRYLPDANYYDNKYYNVSDSDQVYEGTFCSPALAGDKTEYALLSGAGGVMVFRVGCDKTMDDPCSVACGIQNSLNRHLTNW